MIMLSSKECFQLRFIEADPKQQESPPNHPQRVEEDAKQGGGLDLGEHGDEGDVEEDANGGGEKPGRELSTWTEHQAGHLGSSYVDCFSVKLNVKRKWIWSQIGGLKTQTKPAKAAMEEKMFARTAILVGKHDHGRNINQSMRCQMSSGIELWFIQLFSLLGGIEVFTWLRPLIAKAEQSHQSENRQSGIRDINCSGIK